MSQDKDARARILIVEDELIIAQNLKFRLEKLGYAVTDISIDADETRKSLSRSVPDLVLMDIALYGGHDGVILAKWIDKNYKIPIIYVTSHTDTSTFERASKSMPYGYLIKPFNPKELYNTIELALQRHKLLMQLSSSSHLLGSVLQSIADAIIVADKKRNILYMNDSAERLLGARYDDVRTMSITDLLPFKGPDNGSVPAEWNLETIPENTEVEFESRLRLKNRNRFLQVRLSNLNNDLRRDVPEGYLIIMRDVTLRRKTENIIMRIAGAISGETGEAFFQSLTHHLTETLEVDYCLLGEIREDNPDICHPEAFHSRHNDRFDPAPFKLEGTPCELILEEKKTLVYADSIRDRFPDDPMIKKYQVQAYATTPLMTSSGQVVGLLLVMTREMLDQEDILKSVLRIFGNRAAAEIERRRYEQRLITERNRANEMNTLKNNFLSNMSHEVRTPLNSIIGFASLLKEEIDKDEHREFLGYIEDGGQRLLHTINDLLDLSILESAPARIDIMRLDLESEVLEAISVMQNLADDKNLSLEYTVKKPSVKIMADSRMVNQILRKIIDNALKFTPEGGVTVEVDTGWKGSRKYGIVRVSDSGIGIDESFLPHIFDEFKQESQGLGRKYEGVGLGLTIAKKVATLLEGNIEVQTEKGKGTVFSIWLPMVH